MLLLVVFIFKKVCLFFCKIIGIFVNDLILFINVGCKYKLIFVKCGGLICGCFVFFLIEFKSVEFFL